MGSRDIPVAIIAKRDCEIAAAMGMGQGAHANVPIFSQIQDDRHFRKEPF
jgi:hypothetical protein